MVRTTAKSKANAELPDSKKNKRVFDITKPGKSAPQASSRPIIVGNRVMLKDPMMKESDEVVAVPSRTAPEITSKTVNDTPKEEKLKINIKVPESSKTKTDELDKTEFDNSSTDNSEQKVDDKLEPTETLEPAKIKPEPAVESESDSDPEPPFADATKEKDAKPDKEEVIKTSDSLDDDPDEEANKTKPSAADKKSADEVVNQAYERLIESKKYYVPIGEKKRRRSLRILLLVIILLLVAAITTVNLMIDAGTVKTNIKPITHVFTEQQ